MTAVDAPPGLGLAAAAAGEYSAHPRARRLARRSALCTLAAGAGAIFAAGGDLDRAGASGIVISAGVCMTLSLVLLIVRHAVIRVGADGVSWAVGPASVRMDLDRIAGAEVYRDGIALAPARGAVWFLSARDWRELTAMPAELARLGVPVTRWEGKAPLAARAQGYGLAVDILFVALATLATASLALGALL